LEATFTPLFKVMLDNRDSLFGAGDRRVASLMMWQSKGFRRGRSIRGPWRLGAGAAVDLATRQLFAMVWRLLLSQAPHHDPADQPLPDWADTWMREYEQGSDMTKFYPRPPAVR
jgi:hypothetical protein